MSMVNNKSPLDLCDPQILEKINNYQGLSEFLNLCFSREKEKRPTAATLLANPLFDT
jgi:hypothetical protein